MFNFIKRIFGFGGFKLATRAYENNARQVLTEALSGDKYTWRNVDTLSQKIGQPDSTYTVRLLVAIGARASQTDATLWALRSRVGG